MAVVGHRHRRHSHRHHRQPPTSCMDTSREVVLRTITNYDQIYLINGDSDICDPSKVTINSGVHQPPIVINFNRKLIYHRRPSPVKVSLLRMVVPVFIAMVMRTFLVSGQNCFGGIETFEKVAMTDFDDQYTPAGILLHQADAALTRDCINLCKQQPTCLSFGLDYVRFRCAAYAVNAYGRGQDLIHSNATNFFEKVCYRGVAREDYERFCGVERLWAFERVRGAYLEGHTRMQLANVGSRAECAKACLMEASFVCRSADYDEQSRSCRLSKEDRRTQPQAFRLVPGSGREYLENQCASPGECYEGICPEYAG